VTTSEHDELVELICHTDAGSQYTSILYTERLGEVGAAPSIGTIGDCLFTGYYDWMESERSLRRLQDSAA
jgi:transposase InsO family protein